MLSLQHGFVFVHIPKTAGNTIQDVLRAYADDEVRILAPHHDGIHRFEVRSTRYNTHKHSTLAEYELEYGGPMLAQLFKFACVRNPWERAISYYFSPHRGPVVWDRTAFVSFLPTIRPVIDYLAYATDGVASLADATRNLDYLMRFETLAADFTHVCRQVGLPDTPLLVRNRSGSHPYRDYYDEELVKLVGERFGEEIEHFGYSV